MRNNREHAEIGQLLLFVVIRGELPGVNNWGYKIDEFCNKNVDFWG